jgi:hypothetical protein
LGQRKEQGLPDTQTLNSVLGAYGASNLLNSTGGFNWWNIIGGIFFGIIGMYAFGYGRKEKNWRPMVIGIVLMVYPYFVSNTILAFAIGISLTAALFLWRE